VEMGGGGGLAALQRRRNAIGYTEQETAYLW
jgi:hypothetical protein